MRINNNVNSFCPSSRPRHHRPEPRLQLQSLNLLLQPKMPLLIRCRHLHDINHRLKLNLHSQQLNNHIPLLGPHKRLIQPNQHKHLQRKHSIRPAEDRNLHSGPGRDRLPPQFQYHNPLGWVWQEVDHTTEQSELLQGAKWVLLFDDNWV